MNKETITIMFLRVVGGALAIAISLGAIWITFLACEFIYKNPKGAFLLFIIPICYFVGKFIENKMDVDTR